MNIEALIFNNFRIKMYAFLISFIFWVIILGQKDIVVTKEISVEYQLSPGFQVNDSTEKLTITLSGKRSSLRQFDPNKSAVVFDLRDLSLGSRRIPASLGSLDLPFGVKVLSFDPRLVSVYLTSRSVE